MWVRVKLYTDTDKDRDCVAVNTDHIAYIKCDMLNKGNIYVLQMSNGSRLSITESSYNNIMSLITFEEDLLSLDDLITVKSDSKQKKTSLHG